MGILDSNFVLLIMRNNISVSMLLLALFLVGAIIFMSGCAFEGDDSAKQLRLANELQSQQNDLLKWQNKLLQDQIDVDVDRNSMMFHVYFRILDSVNFYPTFKGRQPFCEPENRRELYDRLHEEGDYNHD